VSRGIRIIRKGLTKQPLHREDRGYPPVMD
jgi:hypothetical protein